MARVKEHRAPVRYSITAAQRREVVDLARGHGGLTSEEVRHLAKKLGAAMKPLLLILKEVKLPILPDRPNLAPCSRDMPGDQIVSTRTGKPSEVSQTDKDREELRSLRAKLKTDQAEAARQRQVADQETAAARKAVAQAAELRRTTAVERAEAKDIRRENRELREALSRSQAEVQRLRDMDPEIVETLPLALLEPLMLRTYIEIERRKSGGRRKQQTPDG